MIPLDEQELAFRRWAVAVVGGETVLSFADFRSVERGVGVPTHLRKPPRMEDSNGLVDGVFIFYDVDHNHPDERFRNEYDLEVVPQNTGNVEVTCAGTVITIAHSDRMDLVRALLHDFHYSPERGGPNDDQD